MSRFIGRRLNTGGPSFRSLKLWSAPTIFRSSRHCRASDQVALERKKWRASHGICRERLASRVAESCLLCDVARPWVSEQRAKAQVVVVALHFNLGHADWGRHAAERGRRV